MRLLLTILFLCSMLIATGQIYRFEGIVYAEGGKRLPDALVVMRSNKDSIKTDEKGYFEFTSTEQKDMLLDISMMGFRPVSIYIGYTRAENKPSEIFLCKLCKYDSSGKICPVCKLSDKVVEIVYGLPIPPLKDDVYYAGYCDVTCCDPKHYCLRDKKEF